MLLPVRIDFPRDKALAAATVALCFQAALRILRFDFEVRFLGTAMMKIKLKNKLVSDLKSDLI